MTNASELPHDEPVRPHAQGVADQVAQRLTARPLDVRGARHEPDDVTAIAQDLDLDVDRFRADLASPEVARAVEADFAQGQAIGVTGTPAFVINGVPVIGAQPTHVFVQAIEKAAQDLGS